MSKPTTNRFSAEVRSRAVRMVLDHQAEQGLVEYAAPQVRDTPEPFLSAIRAALGGRTEALEGLAVELLARGLSVRDIEDAFRDESGRLLLSRTAVSELGEQLWTDYQDFSSRDLSEYEIVYLFVDGIAERLRPGQRREPVMAAWGSARTGAGAAAADGGLQGGRRDGEGLLPGHARPRARRSRCWSSPTARPASSRRSRPASRARPASAAWRIACGTSPPRSRRPVARVQGPRPGRLPGAEPGDRPRSRRRRPRRPCRQLPCAVACFEDDFEACIAHLRMPVTHRRSTRTTNLLERLFLEERRRLKIIPNGFGEKPVLKLMFGALVRAAERWRGLPFTEFELRQLAAIREDLNREYEAAIIPTARSSQPRFSSRNVP